MILPGKQSKRDSAEREQNGVRAKPGPMSSKFDETNRRDNEEDDSRHHHPAKNVERVKPGIDPIAKGNEIFHAATEHNHRPRNQDQFAKAYDSRKKIKNAVAVAGEQWAVITLANHHSHWPKQNRHA